MGGGKFVGKLVFNRQKTDYYEEVFSYGSCGFGNGRLRN